MTEHKQMRSATPNEVIFHTDNDMKKYKHRCEGGMQKSERVERVKVSIDTLPSEDSKDWYSEFRSDVVPMPDPLTHPLTLHQGSLLLFICE